MELFDSEGFGVIVEEDREFGLGYDPDGGDDRVLWPLLCIEQGIDGSAAVYLRPDIARKLAHELLRLIGDAT